jgi:hypothetical protein
VGGFGYPALVAYKPKDGKFAIPKGAFDQTQIQEVKAEQSACCALSLQLIYHLEFLILWFV